MEKNIAFGNPVLLQCGLLVTQLNLMSFRLDEHVFLNMALDLSLSISRTIECNYNGE